MQLPSASERHSWPTPNYINPTVVRNPDILILNCFFFPIAFLLVALRIFTRLRISRNFAVDDILLIPATLSALGCTILICLAVTQMRWDRHVWDVPPPLVSAGLKITVVLECVLGISLTFMKMSLLIWTRKRLTSDVFKRIAAAGILVVVCSGLTFDLLVIFNCRSVSAYWILSATPQNCIDERSHLMIGGIVNTTTNFLILFLLLKVFIVPRVYRRQQIPAFVLLLVGFAACVASVVKIWYISKATSTYDRTWVSYGRWICTFLELDLGLICTAILGCSPFIARFIPALKAQSKSRYTPRPLTTPDFSQDKSSLFESDSSPRSELNAPMRPPPVRTPSARYSSPRTDSRQMVPLASLSPPRSTRDRQSKRSSNTSISTFITTMPGRGNSFATNSTFDFEAVNFSGSSKNHEMLPFRNERYMNQVSSTNEKYQNKGGEREGRYQYEVSPVDEGFPHRGWSLEERDQKEVSPMESGFANREWKVEEGYQSEVSPLDERFVGRGDYELSRKPSTKGDGGGYLRNSKSRELLVNRGRVF